MLWKKELLRTYKHYTKLKIRQFQTQLFHFAIRVPKNFQNHRTNKKQHNNLSRIDVVKAIGMGILCAWHIIWMWFMRSSQFRINTQSLNNILYDSSTHL